MTSLTGLNLLWIELLHHPPDVQGVPHEPVTRVYPLRVFGPTQVN